MKWVLRIVGFVLVGLVVAALVYSFVATSRLNRPALPPPAATVASAPAQTNDARGVKNFIASPADDKGQRMRIQGEEARLLPGGQLDLRQMILETQRHQQKDLIIEAPQCIYDSRQRAAFSDGEILVRAADGRLTLRGRGFRWLEAESRLIISNDVQTTVRKRSFSQSGSAAPPAPRPSSTSTNSEFIQINSQTLDYRSEVALFTGSVRAVETDARLACEKLAVHFVGEGGRLERIEAEENVAIEQAGARASGDRATYIVEPNQGVGVIQINGRAAWQHGLRQGTANTLLLDRVRNLVRAEGEARMKLPRESLGREGSLFPAVSPAAPAPALPGDLIEVAAESLTLQLPPTNGPVQRIVAERNVVIASPGENSKATANKAVYDEAAGRLELTGDPVWQSEAHVVRGEMLALDRSTRVFSARPRAHVRWPLAALGKSSLLAANPILPRAAADAGNLFLEVTADDFEYRTNRLDFRENVRAQVLEGGVKRAEMECSTLGVQFARQIESILASGNVSARQFPSPKEGGKSVERELHCASLSARFAGGQLESFVAEGGVRGGQTALRANSAAPVRTRVEAEILTARFLPGTNAVEQVLAERNVVIEQEGRVAKGAQALYRGPEQILELTGQPTARFPEGRIHESDVLIWDAAKQQLRVKGRYKSEWQQSGLARKTAQESGLSPSR